jgi:hypothetical protein
MRGPACWKAQNRFKDISPVHEYVSKKKETNTVVYYYLRSTIKLPCLIESRSKIKLPLCRNPALVLQEEGTYKLSQKVVAQKMTVLNLICEKMPTIQLKFAQLKDSKSVFKSIK